MKRSKLVVMICALALVVGVLVLPVLPVGAVDVISDTCVQSPDSAICKGKDEKVQPVLKTVVDTLLFVVGIIAIVMIIVGAIRYTLSAGEAKKIEDAKNTILYAVIGLVVAFSAYAMISWVSGLFDPSVAQKNCEQAGKTYDTATKVCK
jgi:O-antigen/teichoic acid export membrane protein